MPAKRSASTSTRRTRVEPPTLDEAIYAAQGLSDDPAEQTRIAAALTGIPEADVKARVLQSVRPERSSVVSRPAGRPPVVVERRGSRIIRRESRG